jgi:hypothetical protein
MTLKPGIYEELISHSLKNAIEDTKNQNHDVTIGKVDSGESHQIIARHMQRILARSLADINTEEHIALYNDLLEIIQKHNARYNKFDMLLSPAERLLEVHDPMLPISCNRKYSMQTGLISYVRLLNGVEFEYSGMN